MVCRLTQVATTVGARASYLLVAPVMNASVAGLSSEPSFTLREGQVARLVVLECSGRVLFLMNFLYDCYCHYCTIIYILFLFLFVFLFVLSLSVSLGTI